MIRFHNDLIRSKNNILKDKIKNIDDESDIERYKYTSFGEEVKCSDTVKNPWRFCSKRWL